MAPPNLPEWDNADIFTPLRNAFRVPVMPQNDADACSGGMEAWRGERDEKYGVLNLRNRMGAGMILNGQLYQGSTCMAGEVGHIRLKGWALMAMEKLAPLRASAARRRDRQFRKDEGTGSLEKVLFPPSASRWICCRR